MSSPHRGKRVPRKRPCAHRPVTLASPVAMSISSSPMVLPVVRSAAQRLCELIGFDSQAVDLVVLGLDEALANIIRHAYQGAVDGRIDIQFVPLKPPHAGLRITLRDYALAVDAPAIAARLTGRGGALGPESLGAEPGVFATLRPGGLGVHIISRCMDEVDYAAADGGGTQLQLVKYLNNVSAGPKRRGTRAPARST